MINDNYVILVINGGAGKNVLATSVVKAIKKHYPEKKIIVFTSYKDIWLYNPYIYKCFLHGVAPYFYNDYIKGKKHVIIIAIDPYSTSDYILKKKHLIEIWCDIAGVKYNNEKPELFFNQRESEYAQRRFFDGRKIMLIQTNGGYQKDIKISWMRDMPLNTAQEVVEYFKKDYRIIHIRREDQPTLNNVESFSGNNFRELISLIKMSQKRIFIDSSCQHIASALRKPSTVIWIRNNPEILGHSIHDNIVTKVEDEIDSTSNSIFEPYSIEGNIYECPFKEDTKLFNPAEIIQSINQQKNNL